MGTDGARVNQEPGAFTASTHSPVCPTYLTRRVLRQLHRADLHVEHVHQQQTRLQRLAAAHDELQRFARLHGAHDADERREHAHHRAAHLFEVALFGKQAVIARTVIPPQVENRNLAIEAYTGSRYQWLA